jgi:tetratricopeptide (TPR) repeat protein
MCNEISQSLAILATAGLAGSIGGLAVGVNSPNVNPVKVPFTSRTINLGVLGDMIVGMAAGLAALLLVGILPGNDLGTVDLKPVEYVRLVAFGIISGFAGIKILSRLSDQILQQVDSMGKKVEEAEETSLRRDDVQNILREATFYRANERYDEAIIAYQKTLGIDPANEEARIGIAITRNYKDPSDVDEPIKMLTEALQTNPRSGKAYYNRACIKNLDPQRKYSKLDILADLKRSIDLDATFKPIAKQDADFKDLWKDPDFVALVG